MAVLCTQAAEAREAELLAARAAAAEDLAAAQAAAAAERTRAEELTGCPGPPGTVGTVPKVSTPFDQPGEPRPCAKRNAEENAD